MARVSLATLFIHNFSAKLGVESGKCSSHATFAMVSQLLQFGKVIAAAAEEERERERRKRELFSSSPTDIADWRAKSIWNIAALWTFQCKHRAKSRQIVELKTTAIKQNWILAAVGSAKKVMKKMVPTGQTNCRKKQKHDTQRSWRILNTLSWNWQKRRTLRKYIQYLE